MTSSAGASGLSRSASPPRRTIASRIAARSTTHGTPVKSWRMTRAGVKAISWDGTAVGFQASKASMSARVTFTPSSKRSRFSRRIFSEYGSRATFSRGSAARLQISYDWLAVLSVVRALKLSVMHPPQRLAAPANYIGWGPPRQIGTRPAERSPACPTRARQKLLRGRLLARSRQNCFDHRAAQTELIVVRHGVLAWGDGALRLIKGNARGAIGQRLERCGLIGLPVTHFDRAAEGALSGADQPVNRTGAQRCAGKQRVVMPLHHDERVPRTVLCRHVPGLLGMTALPADMQSLALPECVESKSLMSAERMALGRLDGARMRLQKAAEKLAKGPLADEADPGAVGLVEDGQTGSPCELAHRALGQIPQRHEGLRQLAHVHGVQKITLILAQIAGLAKLEPARPVHQARVVPRCKAYPAESAHILQRNPKLDFPIAEHV